MGSELIFEGKKYISASRASSITGYNSDYIGQLCRKSLLDCRRVGRSWFVSEESLLAHRTTASLTPRGRISIYQKNSEVSNFNSSAGAGAATMSNSITNPLGFGINPELSYKSFHQAAINFLDRKEAKRQTSVFAQRIVGGVLVVVLLLVFVVPNVIGGNQKSNFLSHINLGGVQISAVQNQISGSLVHIKNYRSELVSSVAYTSHVFSSIGMYLDQQISDLVNGTQIRITRVNSFIAVTGQKIGRPFFWSQQNEKSDESGLVVVPSAGSPDANAHVKAYVENNFSDEAKIVPDETGTSGLIKPVFKNKNDQEYLYVMVPVKDGEEP